MASIRNTGKAGTFRFPSASRMKQFLDETWIELRYKVTWSSKAQLIKSTAVVLTVVVIVSCYIYVLDNFFGFVLRNTILK